MNKRAFFTIADNNNLKYYEMKGGKMKKGETLTLDNMKKLYDEATKEYTTFDWQFSKGKYFLNIALLRFHWKYGLPYKIDVLFKLYTGYGLILGDRQSQNGLRYGLFFWIDALRFNVDGNKYKALGFSIPLGRKNFI